MKTLLVISAILGLFGNAVASAQEVANSSTVPQAQGKASFKPQYKAHTLFSYPNEHPVYIVTYTQQDLEKIKQDRFLHDLKKASLSK